MAEKDKTIASQQKQLTATPKGKGKGKQSEVAATALGLKPSENAYSELIKDVSDAYTAL